MMPYLPETHKVPNSDVAEKPGCNLVSLFRKYEGIEVAHRLKAQIV